MRLNDAVHDVTGEIFRDGWSRIRGGSMQGGLQASRQRQLVRAAAGHRAAVFKAIRGGGGGTHTKSQLMNQLDYLTTKSRISWTAAASWTGRRSSRHPRSRT